MTFSEYHNRWGKKLVIYTPLITAFGNMRTLLGSIDIDVEITDGWRGESEQHKALAGGKSNAKFGDSPHNYGMAFDCCPIVDGKLYYEASEFIWKRIGEAGQKHGLQWGNDWDTDGIVNAEDKTPGGKIIDRPHFQVKTFKRDKPTLKLYYEEPPIG